MAGATVPSAARIETAAHGIATAASGEGRSLMNDRQGLVSALRRSLGDSRGISDVLNEFQDGL
jgi:class 3 adenylate cyclase